MSRSEVSDNRNEGMDMDEAGEGSIVGIVIVTVDKSTLTDNGEWGVEAEGGSGSADVSKSDLSGNADGEVEIDI